MTSNWNVCDLSACRWLRAPATMHDERLADASAANPFLFTQTSPRNGCVLGSNTCSLSDSGTVGVRRTFSTATSSGAPKRIPRDIYNGGHVLWATLGPVGSSSRTEGGQPQEASQTPFRT